MAFLHTIYNYIHDTSSDTYSIAKNTCIKRVLYLSTQCLGMTVTRKHDHVARQSYLFTLEDEHMHMQARVREIYAHACLQQPFGTHNSQASMAAPHEHGCDQPLHDDTTLSKDHLSLLV